MNVVDHVRDMAAAGLYSNVRILSSLLLTMSNNNPELFSPAQKYQLLVYHADAIFHDKEYRNAACKYSMALQQKKVLNKTSKVRTSTGGAAANIQAQSLPSEIEVKYKIAECYTILKLDKDAIAVLDGIPSRQRTPKINMMLANLYRKAGQERSAVTSYKEVLRQCPLALDAIIGLLSLSVKGAEVASMTMDVIQSLPNLDWLSVWIKAYAFIHAGDNQRAINTICSLEKKSLLRDNADLLVSLADVHFRAGDTKNAILKFEQAQMLDPYLIKGETSHGYFVMTKHL
ncbi:Anaphase promoting complex subunit 7 [Xenoophorus captivus]|uniref:Anaphase promoting complex subunit 7 n=1 Tax=Xenoophorus captivus TaxID=1517983 RepID=A0ABV0QNN6_9TELE